MVVFLTFSEPQFYHVNEEVRLDNHFGNNMVLQGHCHSQINPSDYTYFSYTECTCPQIQCLLLTSLQYHFFCSFRSNIKAAPLEFFQLFPRQSLPSPPPASHLRIYIMMYYNYQSICIAPWQCVSNQDENQSLLFIHLYVLSTQK